MRVSLIQLGALEILRAMSAHITAAAITVRAGDDFGQHGIHRARGAVTQNALAQHKTTTARAWAGTSVA